MDGTGRAHFLKPLLQRLPATVESHGHVVKGHTEASRDAITRLVQEISTPDHFGIFRLERRQEPVEAITNRSIEFAIRLNGEVLDVCLL